MRYYTRDDVELRYVHGEHYPTVNVKVYTGPREAWRDWARYETDADPRFSEEWVEENISDEYLDGLFWRTCEWEWEQIEQDLEEVYPGQRLSVERHGRCGGWAVVRGLDSVEEWDAIAVARWRRFERYAKQIAAGIPFQMLQSLYLNEFEVWRDEESERLGAEAFSPEQA